MRKAQKKIHGSLSLSLSIYLSIYLSISISFPFSEKSRADLAVAIGRSEKWRVTSCVVLAANPITGAHMYGERRDALMEGKGQAKRGRGRTAARSPLREKDARGFHRGHTGADAYTYKDRRRDALVVIPVCRHRSRSAERQHQTSSLLLISVLIVIAIRSRENRPQEAGNGTDGLSLARTRIRRKKKDQRVVSFFVS